jgi:osmotically inducible protein OsmC
MALSAGLGRAGTPPTTLEVNVTVKFDKVDSGWKVVSSNIDVRGKISGIDSDGFRKAADAAKDGCPISQALAGNVELSATATLEN